jgi:tetratricopeptide (TPR) repeat protein
MSELRLETNHAGRVLVVRTITDPMRMQSVQNAIEDSKLHVDQLAVYNTDPKATPDQVLPKGTIFAIKEPYYKTAASGGYLLRVDHPSDIIRLQPNDPLVPRELAPRVLELDKGALSYKNVGNESFKNKDYLSAFEAYTKGLTACDDNEDSLRRDLFRNRSIVSIYLQRYETAAADANDALISDACDDATVAKNNVKARYRAGRAFYCLENYSEAHKQFEKLLHISPDDQDTLEQLAKAKARYEESVTGKYDFTAKSESTSATHKRLDHASFTTNVAILSSSKKGRGLFATKDIKAGELVLVEKAFSVAFASELGTETHIIMNLNTNTARIGAHSSLYYQLVQKMIHNPTQAKRMLELFDGGYSPKCEAQTVDGIAVIDTFQVAAIMEHNCFGCAETRTADALGAAKASDRESKSVGVWILASYFNHACDANAHRSFMGDIMVVRAGKDIKKDEEISIAYRAPEFDYDKTQEELQKIWKFKCDCTICTAEAKTPAPQRKERKALVKEIAAFLDSHRKAIDYCSDKATIAKAEKLYTKLEATYDKKVFTNVPRIALAYLGEWICGVYQTEQNMHKVIDASHRALHDLG